LKEEDFDIKILKGEGRDDGKKGKKNNTMPSLGGILVAQETLREGEERSGKKGRTRKPKGTRKDYAKKFGGENQKKRGEL